MLVQWLGVFIFGFLSAKYVYASSCMKLDQQGKQTAFVKWLSLPSHGFLFRLTTSSKCEQISTDILLSLNRFFDTLRRHNYVTPTSYLELILTFKNLLNVKRNDIMMMKNRYVKGLEKLEFAASQVSVMQQELTDLQPELIKTSADTEKLMIKIEQDTVEVEAKKEVSERHGIIIWYSCCERQIIG